MSIDIEFTTSLSRSLLEPEHLKLYPVTQNYYNRASTKKPQRLYQPQTTQRQVQRAAEQQQRAVLHAGSDCGGEPDVSSATDCFFWQF